MGGNFCNGLILDVEFLVGIPKGWRFDHWEKLIKQNRLRLWEWVVMDGMAPRYKDLELDLENGVTVIEEEDYSRSPISGVKKKAQLLLAKVKGSFAEGSDDRVSLSGDASNSNSVHVENLPAVTSMSVERQESKDAKENKLVKEKRKSLGNKKPPRPPRAPSLDAADQKIIREIAELARLKRARIERMKALKKMKAAKATSSNSNMFALVFTVIFCLVIMFQGNISLLDFRFTILPFLLCYF